jgi:hypothetical protein
MSNRPATFLVGLTVSTCLMLGCNGSPDSGPPPATPPIYPPGWELWGHDNDFRVPTGAPLLHDQALGEWFQKGFAGFPTPYGAGGWGCTARSRTENGTRYAVVIVRLPEPRSMLGPVTDNTFAMIARRSPDMKETEGAGAGYGQGNVYQGENDRLFVRIGLTQTRMYILSIRGPRDLDATEPHLRAFFDGFTPLMQ